MLLAIAGVGRDSLSLPLRWHTLSKNSLVRDFCNCQWRCPHSSPGRHASCETWHSTRRTVQKGTLVSLVVNGRLPHLLSQLRLQLLQGVPAQHTPTPPPPPANDHALLYYAQLSSITFKMMAESSGLNPDLLMQFIMNF